MLNENVIHQAQMNISAENQVQFRQPRRNNLRYQHFSISKEVQDLYLCPAKILIAKDN